MRNITTLFILVFLFSFISCDTVVHYTIKVSVDKNPTLTIINQTGYQVTVTAPLSTSINHGARTQCQPREANQNMNVTYTINRIPFTEQVTWNNTDTTVTLTKRPPTLAVLNQTGYSVVVTAPVSSSIANGVSSQFLLTEAHQSINVTYRIEQIEFTEQATMNDADAAVTLTKKPPTVTVVNQTGRPVSLSSPQHSNLDIGQRTQFLSPVLTGNFNITYSSGKMRLTEQVTMNNQDVTVNLTAGAPTLTIVNNTGQGNNVNIIQFQIPGNREWIGGNATIRDNEFYLVEGTALQGVRTQLLANGESWPLWLGNLDLSGNTFNIRLQTPSDTIFQKNNVRITSDMTLTFTANDRR